MATSKHNGGAIVLCLVLMLPAALWEAWVVRQALAWFVPQVPHMGLWTLIGAIFTLRLVTWKHPEEPLPMTWERAKKSVMEWVMLPMFALAFCALIHLFAA